jgi:hypothetical protein
MDIDDIHKSPSNLCNCARNSVVRHQHNRKLISSERPTSRNARFAVRIGDQEVTEGCGLIDSWRNIRQTSSGRMTELRMNPSDGVFNAVTAREILTISRDYFRLIKLLEGRVYELACSRRCSLRTDRRLARVRHLLVSPRQPRCTIEVDFPEPPF